MKNKTVSMFKSPMFKLGLLIAFAAAALTIVIAMMLGNESGQFVIRVQSSNPDRSIAITDNGESYTSKLQVEGINGMVDYSPGHFLEEDYETLNDITAELGRTDYANHALLIYTFNIKNTSASGGVGVRAELTYSHVTNKLDKIVRVLTYVKGNGIYDPNVYQLEDDDPFTYDEYVLQPKLFKKETNTVFDDQKFNIGYGDGQDFVKYSILFWLEGNDPDSEKYEQELYNGTIRFDLTLHVEMTT